jgi:hypothetical protein
MSASNVGRNARFAKKRVDGELASTALWAAVYGDAAATEGAYFASMILHAPKGTQPRFVKPSSAEHAAAKFEEAVLESDSKFFREVADYIDARKKTRADGPADPVFAECAAYICACTDAAYRHNFSSPRWRQLFIETSRAGLVAALDRPTRVPTVNDLFKHVCAVFPDHPDYNTVKRHAQVLGIKKRTP